MLLDWRACEWKKVRRDLDRLVHCCGGGVKTMRASPYGIKRSCSGLCAFWKHLSQQTQNWLAARKVVLATRGKSNGVTLNNWTIMHATQSIYKRRILKAARKGRLVRRDSTGTKTAIGKFKYIYAAEYVQDQPKFPNI